MIDTRMKMFISGFKCNFIRAVFLVAFVFSFNLKASGQHDSLSKNSDTINNATGISKTKFRNRKLFIAGVNIAGYGGSLLILNQTWYKDFPRTSFHTFNDSREWLQMDKIGHSWAAYNAGRVSAAMWKWAGVPQRKAVIIGGLSSTAYLTAVEFMDAYSEKWGWSWADIAANFGGSGLLIGQELLWQEQRIQLKFSFHGNKYGDPILEKRANELFGKNWYERMLKDYNAQTHWLSANLKSFFPDSRIPAWLNVAVGYGADGMYGGFENVWADENAGPPINRSDIPRKRQFYLAPDIDFTKIPTNKKWLRTVFTFLNAFKCPAPAVMVDGKGKVRFYPVYF
jgi:hypothetical protein